MKGSCHVAYYLMSLIAWHSIAQRHIFVVFIVRKHSGEQYNRKSTAFVGSLPGPPESSLHDQPGD